MKKNKFIFYVVPGIFLFFFFLYQTFPYSLLKEKIIEQTFLQFKKSNLPLKVQIESLHPYWLSGLEFSNVQIGSNVEDKAPLLLDKVIVRVSFLPLLLGKLIVDLKVSQKNNLMTSSVTFPLFSIIFGDISVSKLSISAKSFPLDNVFAQVITAVSSVKDANMEFLSSPLSKMIIGGDLNGSLDYSANNSTKVDLSLNHFYISFNNDFLKIPTQKFSNAQVKFLWDGNRLTIRKDDIVFKAPNISFYVTGALKKPQNLPVDVQNMTANLNLRISMFREIEKSFGFLLPQLLNCPPSAMVDGIMNVKLFGQLNRLTCSKQ